MVSEATRDFMFNVVDANNEFNTKIIILCLFFIYLVFSLWWANRIIPFKTTRDEMKKYPIYKQVSVKLMRVTSVVFLFFFLLILGIFMRRDYSIDSLVTLIITGYSIITMIMLGIWFFYGMDWVQDFLATIGIQTKNKRGTLIRRKD